MKPFGVTAIAWGFCLASALAVRGIKRKTLSKSGAAAAFMVGFLSIAAGWRSGFLLIGFYQIGSSATKFKKDFKQKLDATAVTASARGPDQVLGCSLLATICAVLHAIYCGEEAKIAFGENSLVCFRLNCAILSHYACCCADTLASELGILSQTPPILITRPFKTVPPGTNGGISLWGTTCSIWGGAAMGVVCLLTDHAHMTMLYAKQLIMFGGVCGFVGSLLDSLLGATLQTSYFDPDTKLVYSGRDEHVPVPPSAKRTCGANVLTNVQVNVLSTVLTMLLAAFFLGPLVFQEKEKI